MTWLWRFSSKRDNNAKHVVLNQTEIYWKRAIHWIQRNVEQPHTVKQHTASCSVWMRAEKCEKKHEQPKKTHSDMQSMWENVRSPPAPFRNVSNIIVTPDYFNVMGCVWNRIVYTCFRQLLSCVMWMYNILKTVNGGSLSHSETLFSIFCIIFCANHNIVQLSYCQYEVELRPLHCGKY